MFSAQETPREWLIMVETVTIHNLQQSLLKVCKYLFAHNHWYTCWIDHFILFKQITINLEWKKYITILHLSSSREYNSKKQKAPQFLTALISK